MKKVVFSLVAAIFLLTGLALACAPKAPPTPAPEKEVIHLDVVFHWPEMSPVIQEAYKPVMEEIKESSKGRITYTLYSGESLCKAADSYDAIRVGKADMGCMTLGFTPGRFPLCDVFSLPATLPTTRDLGDAVMATFDRTLYQEFPDTHALMAYKAGGNFYYMGNKEVRTLEDWKGLKIRSIGGLMTHTIEALGATPIMMAIPDIYLALDTGVIDGAILGSPMIPSFRLQEVVKYVLKVGLGSTAEWLGMNKDTWGKIPDDLKPIVDTAGRHIAYYWLDMPEKHEAKYFSIITDAGGLVYSLTPEETERLTETLKPVVSNWVADLEAKGLPAEEVLAIWREELQKRGISFPY